jgi:hypothetical protein
MAFSVAALAVPAVNASATKIHFNITNPPFPPLWRAFPPARNSQPPLSRQGDRLNPSAHLLVCKIIEELDKAAQALVRARASLANKKRGRNRVRPR